MNEKQIYNLIYYVTQEGKEGFKKVTVKCESLSQMLKIAHDDIKSETTFKIEITIDYMIVATVN